MKKIELPPCGLTASIGPNWQNPDAFSVGSDEPVSLSEILRTESDREELEAQGIRLSLEDLTSLGQPGLHAVLRTKRPEQRMLVFNRCFRGHQEIGFWAVDAETWRTVAREHGGLTVVERSEDAFRIAPDGNPATLEGRPSGDSAWLFDEVIFPPSSLDGIVTTLFGLNTFERSTGEKPAELLCLKIETNGVLSIELPQGGAV